VFVGDFNQLEPIGPGKPFKDMIGLGFPTVTLTNHYRNDSSILSLAKAILKDELDLSLLKQDGIQFIPCATTQEILDIMVRIYLEKDGKYPVISVYREEFSLGIDQINPIMKERINPANTDIGMGHQDPVIQITTTAKVDNGDIGIIQEFNPNHTTRIQFELAKEISYTLHEMVDYLELAYAITATKSQGSQYEGVIIPLLDIKKELTHRHSMWNKNTLYTAITRAQKELILIGDSRELMDGAKHKGVSRRTHLVKRIQKRFGMQSRQPETDKPYV
jgi:exodeoxyribonuclease V alpha subunit